MPARWKAYKGRWRSQVGQGKKKKKWYPIWKNNLKQKGALVVETPPSKHKTLSSNLITTKKEKKISMFCAPQEATCRAGSCSLPSLPPQPFPCAVESLKHTNYFILAWRCNWRQIIAHIQWTTLLSLDLTHTCDSSPQLSRVPVCFCCCLFCIVLKESFTDLSS
jgi:hypothetical protein